MEYVEAPAYNKGGNPFTTLPQRNDDRTSHIIHRGLGIYLMLNIFPYNAGHLLVVPFRQVPDLSQLTQEERSELMETIVLGQAILTQALKPDGFNIGFNTGRAAGASLVDHLHGHIVPRWNSDTNFMPVISNSRVLPAALDTMWSRLKEARDSILSS